MTWQVVREPAARGAACLGAQHRRLHHGPWRVLYRVDPDTHTLHIEHVGRTAI